jgi:hypothetical protein
MAYMNPDLCWLASIIDCLGIGKDVILVNLIKQPLSGDIAW